MHIISNGCFEDVCKDVYSTIQDAINDWCEKTGISQGERTESEMVDFINDYEYDTEDTYYYIHPFQFDKYSSQGAQGSIFALCIKQKR